MLNKLAVISIAVFLTGCGFQKHPLLETVKFVPVIPSEDMYVCPDVKEDDIPTGEVTDRDLASLSLQLYERGEICSNSLKAIRKYVTDSIAEIEKGNKK